MQRQRWIGSQNIISIWWEWRQAFVRELATKQMRVLLVFMLSLT